MMSEPTITVEVDPAADAAYVSLSDSEVARTVEHSPAVMVDLDDLDVVVGVELLTLTAGLTSSQAKDLCRRFHVPTVFEGALPLAFEAITQWVSTNAGIKPPATPRRRDFGAIHSAKATMEECPG